MEYQIKQGEPTEVKIHIDPPPAIPPGTVITPPATNNADISTRDLLIFIIVLLILGLIFYSHNYWFQPVSSSSTMLSPSPSSVLSVPPNNTVSPNYISSPSANEPTLNP